MAREKQIKLPLEAKNKPVMEYKAGSCKAVVWRNTSDKGENWFSTTISRSYKKADGSYAETNQFGRDDLLLVSKLSELAFAFIAAAKN